MEKPDNLKNDSELGQIEGKIRKRLGIDKEDTKRDNFIFRYFVRHILLILGFLVFCTVAAWGIVAFATYMTTMDIINIAPYTAYTPTADEFFYLMLAATFCLFMTGMAIWYGLVNRFANKN